MPIVVQKEPHPNGMLKALGTISKHIDPSTGGNWSAKNRESNIGAVKGVLEKFFKRSLSDPAMLPGRVELENLLTKSKTEASSYDFKQGFYRLDETKQLDEQAFQKILETICALANLGKGKTGYVVIGIADKLADAKRIKQLYQIEPRKVGEFFVVGTDHEARLHSNSDRYFQMISEKIARSKLSEEIRVRVGSSLSQISYFERSVLVIRVDAGKRPCFLDNKMYRRDGASTHEVSGQQILQIGELFQ